MSPQRIQLRRTKGWSKPEGAIVVSRPSKWGNPFAVTWCVRVACAAPGRHQKHWHFYDPDSGAYSVAYGSRAEAISESVWRFADGVRDNECDRYEYLPRPSEIRDELAGRDLACWCPPDAQCHADVLLEIADGGAA